MNYSGEAAEQVVRMSLNGVEVAAKISGKAAERLAVMLYAILRDQNKTRGKIRLSNMLRSGKELKVFAVKDDELQRFCVEAKKYGVLYCVLKDRDASDGLTDIMVRAEDAGKINRIFERFGLATIDMGSVKTDIQQRREDISHANGESEPEQHRAIDNKLDEYLDRVVGAEQPAPAEKEAEGNPTVAQTVKSRQSEPLSKSEKERNDVGVRSFSDDRSRRSVREELKEIREEQRQKSETKIAPELQHIAPPVKKRSEKEVL